MSKKRRNEVRNKQKQSLKAVLEWQEVNAVENRNMLQAGLRELRDEKKLQK